MSKSYTQSTLPFQFIAINKRTKRRQQLKNKAQLQRIKSPNVLYYQVSPEVPISLISPLTPNRLHKEQLSRQQMDTLLESPPREVTSLNNSIVIPSPTSPSVNSIYCDESVAYDLLMEKEIKKELQLAQSDYNALNELMVLKQTFTENFYEPSSESNTSQDIFLSDLYL